MTDLWIYCKNIQLSKARWLSLEFSHYYNASTLLYRNRFIIDRIWSSKFSYMLSGNDIELIIIIKNIENGWDLKRSNSSMKVCNSERYFWNRCGTLALWVRYYNKHIAECKEKQQCSAQYFAFFGLFTFVFLFVWALFTYTKAWIEKQHLCMSMGVVKNVNKFPERMFKQRRKMHFHSTCIADVGVLCRTFYRTNFSIKNHWRTTYNTKPFLSD